MTFLSPKQSKKKKKKEKQREKNSHKFVYRKHKTQHHKRRKKPFMISSHKLCTYTADHIGRDATCQAEKAIKYKESY